MTINVNDTHDPGLRSWVDSANSATTDFPIQNLPYGVFRRRDAGEERRIGVAIGDRILDLARCADAGLLEQLPQALEEAVRQDSLNRLMTVGPFEGHRLRRRLVDILSLDGRRGNDSLLVRMDDAELFVPAAIGDYTDFYASIHHASHVGQLFRPQHPLPPNYKHMPIAYHGRASSIVVSGTPVRRPYGQMKASDDQPRVGPSERLDYEGELGIFVGRGNDLGEPVPIGEADDHLFGLCLLNDWSARDIQVWEGQPLGPFLSKSFSTTVSPWIVTLEALAPFRSPASARPPGDPGPLAYLFSTVNEANGGLDITVDVSIRSADMRRLGLEPMRLSRASFRDMFWTMAQLVAHHTSNGCNLRVGDLLGSGTISGPDDGSLGCLLEITKQGSRAIQLPTGEMRTFLADGDEVIMHGRCAREGSASIGFGECRGVIVPPVARP